MWFRDKETLLGCIIFCCEETIMVNHEDYLLLVIVSGDVVKGGLSGHGLE